MLTRSSRYLAPMCVIALAALSACGGGGSTAGVPVAAPPPTAGKASVTWKMQWAPGASATAAGRRGPQYLSPSAKSASIQTFTQSGAAATAIQYLNAPGTTLTFSAPTGLDTFAIKVYDEPNGVGNVVSVANITQTIASGGATAGNVVTTILNGVVASAKASLAYASGGTTFVAGTAGTANITVTAYDADGNAILETASGVSSGYSTPLAVSVAKLNPLDPGTFTLNKSVLQTTANAPAVLQMNYNGGPVTASTAAATITVSANGITAATVPVGIVPGVYTLAGKGTAGFANGTGAAAQFYYPEGVAVDAAGNVYVADTDNHSIRKITPAGAVTTLAGNGPASTGFADGQGAAAQFAYPYGLTVDAAGNVYVADTENQAIRKITSTGAVTTIAGAGPAHPGFVDGYGVSAEFYVPYGVVVDSHGNFYIADAGNNAIRKLYGGYVSTLAGAGPGFPGFADGTGTGAQFNSPQGVAVDSASNLYVSDSDNNTVRKVAPNGVVTTVAGAAAALAGFVDATGTNALFWDPTGAAADAAGNIYVADLINNAIRKISPGGVVTTLAGAGESSPGYVNGLASKALFNNPHGVAVDGAGNVYVADSYNHVIRKIVQ